MLTIKDLTVYADKKKIIDNMNLAFKKGKIYAVMGPNGSGKSTLAHAILGSPMYEIDKKSKIIFDGKDISNLSTDKRVRNGIFLTFQTPLSLSGVNVYQLIKAASKKRDIVSIGKEVKKYASELKIPDELLDRSINMGASGGERKKLELLQAIILGHSIIIFDEIDTGVDVDALKTMAKFMKKYKQDRMFILITHYNRILKYIRPDEVLIIENGAISKTGDFKLAEEVEKEGYRGSKK